MTQWENSSFFPPASSASTNTWRKLTYAEIAAATVIGSQNGGVALSDAGPTYSGSVNVSGTTKVSVLDLSHVISQPKTRAVVVLHGTPSTTSNSNFLTVGLACWDGVSTSCGLARWGLVGNGTGPIVIANAEPLNPTAAGVAGGASSSLLTDKAPSYGFMQIGHEPEYNRGPAVCFEVDGLDTLRMISGSADVYAPTNGVPTKLLLFLWNNLPAGSAWDCSFDVYIETSAFA